MSRYRDIKPGGEAAADKEDLQRWCGMFSLTESIQDKEWVEKLVEDVEHNMDQNFSTHLWPGKLESTGSITGDAIQVQRNARKNRWENGFVTKESINAPDYSIWAPNRHQEEYNIFFVNHSRDYLSAITYERAALATENDENLHKLMQAIRRNNDNEIQAVLKDMGHPKIGRGPTIKTIDLSIYRECIMVQNRLWVPRALEEEMAAILHLGHKGVDNMIGKELRTTSRTYRQNVNTAGSTHLYLATTTTHHHQNLNTQEK